MLIHSTQQHCLYRTLPCPASQCFLLFMPAALLLLLLQPPFLQDADSLDIAVSLLLIPCRASHLYFAVVATATLAGR
jgi:hypothetical protein